MPMPPAVDARVPMRRGRSDVPGPRGGGVYLSRVQRTRLLDAAAAIVSEEGVGRVSACRVAEYAGMSHKTFYDLFADGEDCFLAVFDRAVDDLAAALAPAWRSEGEWVARVRGALGVLLACLDRDPALCRVVFVEALAAGPRVLARRAEVLDRVAKFIDEGRAGSPVGAELPQLTAAGVAGAAFSIVHARLVEQRSGSLMELLGPLAATVVLPYRGPEAAARELERAVPELPVLPERRVPCARPAPAAPRAKRSRRAARGEPVRERRPGARWVLDGGALLARPDVVGYRRMPLLRAAAVAVDEHGYASVTVAHIAACAKVSRRTFYELFDGREHCLFAVLQDIDARLTAELQAAGSEGLPWRERVRLGLWTVLRFFDREPALARFCVVESARGDERMAAYREELLERIAGAIAEGGQDSLPGGECSPLTAEGTAGAIVSILNTRLSSVTPLTNLLGELMGLVVLPYLGPEAAREERARLAPRTEGPAERPGRSADDSPERALRMTYRSALVLEAIGRRPGISNLAVAGHAHVTDQGQISKLLARLQRGGLIQNTGRSQTRGTPNAWRLTPAGRQVEQNIREHQVQAA
jgi:AcrR family transcriptional regulator